MVCKSVPEHHPNISDRISFCGQFDHKQVMSTAPQISYLKGDYRPDIDGLRAVAVLAVLAFHAFPALLPGGFIGVDIFFVISGYLISKHIWEDLAAGKFSIKTFYARRIRRIFPALGLVLLSSLALGWWILAPGEYEQLGKHVEGGAGFVSNIIYWKEAGYFDNAADTKPLLHLWSLGIEEQFYILWPLILAFLWRQPHHASWVLPTVLVASLSYSIWLVQQNTVADFYSPFTRFWELGLGAILAHEALRTQALSNLIREWLAWIGLGLIVASAVLLNSQDLFPGAWALLPTLGAAALIQSGESTWLNRQLLSRSGLVWIGLVSYPLYLWHWPLLSFARIMESNTPEPLVRLTLLGTSFLLAWVTWRWLERPIRSRPRSKKMILILSILMLAILFAGEAVRKLDGLKFRQLDMLNGDPTTLVLGADRDKLQHECGLSEHDKPLFQYCLRSAARAQYALLGDSKAEALFYGLVREAPADMQWLMIGSVSPPTGHPDLSDKQQRKNILALQTVLNNPDIKQVGITVALRAIFPIDKETGFISSMTMPAALLDNYSREITTLENAGKRVFFVIDNPTFPDPRSCISGGLTGSSQLNQYLHRKENPRCTLNYRSHLAGTRAYLNFVASLQQRHPNLLAYNPTPLLCDIPNNVCRVTQNGKFLYSYGDHISDYANSIVARDLLEKIQR